MRTLIKACLFTIGCVEDKTYFSPAIIGRMSLEDLQESVD